MKDDFKNYNKPRPALVIVVVVGKLFSENCLSAQKEPHKRLSIKKLRWEAARWGSSQINSYKYYVIIIQHWGPINGSLFAFSYDSLNHYIFFEWIFVSSPLSFVNYDEHENVCEKAGNIIHIVFMI